MADFPLAEDLHAPRHPRDVYVQGEQDDGAAADRARRERGQANPAHRRPAGNRATRTRLVCLSVSFPAGIIYRYLYLVIPVTAVLLITCTYPSMRGCANVYQYW